MQSRSRGMYPTRRIAKITIMNQIIWSERNMESAFGQNGTKPWIRRQVNFTSELAKCKYYANMIQGHPLISTNDYAFLFYLLPALGNKPTFLYWEALSTILCSMCCFEDEFTHRRMVMSLVNGSPIEEPGDIRDGIRGHSAHDTDVFAPGNCQVHWGRR